METAHIFKKVYTFIETHALIPPKAHIIIGLSGGPDSVFLLHFFVDLARTYSITITAAHLDHGWPFDSAQDAFFCKELAQNLNIPFVSAHAHELELTVKKCGSQEEHSRILRRFFLEQVRARAHADAIALAHHADDQQENFFIRLIRGSTLSGLTGMRPKNGFYIRPLLSIYKKDIMTYLTAHTIAYRSDPTNESFAFLRNKIRHRVLPALQHIDPRFNQKFSSTLFHLQEAENFLEHITQETFTLLVSSDSNNQQWLDIQHLISLNTYLQIRILRYWLCIERVPFVPTYTFFLEIIKFLRLAKASRHAIHKDWSLIKRNNKVAIIK